MGAEVKASTRRGRLVKEGEEMEQQLEVASRPQLLKLLRKQDYKCALSGIELNPNDAVIDHVLPVSKGGKHTIDNLQILFDEINRMKGNLSNERFIELCSMVASISKIDSGSL
jgi:5-methylcytosine-specific restriction endonuclease McrA